MKLDVKMKYWKVHRKELKYLLPKNTEFDELKKGIFCLKTLVDYNVGSPRYCDGDGYVFISVYDNNVYSGFNYYTTYSIEWYKKYGYQYLGEYHSRKEKLNKINAQERVYKVS